MTPGAAFAVAPAAKISDLPAVTGLTEQQVQMVLGARTAYAEYLTQYDSSQHRFIKAIGQRRLAFADR